MKAVAAFILLAGFLAGCAAADHPTTIAAGPEAAVRLDHVLIATPPGAERERAALEAAGFRIAPSINRHDGQGTASATVEFENGFIELIWPDDSVPVTGEGGARGKMRFIERMNWRTTDVSPFGLALSRTATTPASFPFETWEVRSEWMEPGTSLLMLTPRGSRAVNIAIHPHGTNEAANRQAIAARSAQATMFLHPNGARRLTGVRVTAKGPGGLPPAADFVRGAGAAELVVGKEWLMEISLDEGRRGRTKDFRPVMPLIVRW